MEKIEVKNKNLFKNRTQMVIYTILFIVCIILFIVIGTKNYKISTPNNERFADEYPLVGDKNVFKYVNVLEAHQIASGKKGIVLFGNPSNPWVEYYASIVNDAALDTGIEEIYYYDFYKDREQNNGTYKDLVRLLKDYVIVDDLGRSDIYAPSLLIVSEDKVLLFDMETSFAIASDSPSNYWSNSKKGLKYTELRNIFSIYKGI